MVWTGFEIVLVARCLRRGSEWFSVVEPEEGRKGRKGGREKGRKGGGRGIWEASLYQQTPDVKAKP